MNFEADEVRAWGPGSVGLIAAGLVHLGTLLLQLLGTLVLLVGVAVGGSASPTELAMGLGVFVGCPSVISFAVGLLLLLAARLHRDRGVGPVVILAVVAGVFWPGAQMALMLLFCAFPFMPLYVVNALATLIATAIVVSHGTLPPARIPRQADAP